jgi:hypothetical protein
MPKLLRSFWIRGLVMALAALPLLVAWVEVAAAQQRVNP